MLTIDGAAGEGGGQVLRTALGLSLVTGEPFVIERIRAGRAKPGLQRQHLAAVDAAAAIGGARVEGAALGAQRLAFRPDRVRGGDYRFAIGTAGSTTLVLQTILPALLRADRPSSVVLGGGTHNPLAPPFEFLQLAFAPVLRSMGASLDLQLLRHGFAPAGGGTLAVNVAPSPSLRPPSLLERGRAGLRRARALLANLPDEIARRELAVVRRRLDVHPEELLVERVEAAGPGNVLLLELPAEGANEVIAAFGERGVRAEDVAAKACNEALAFLATTAPVGTHLADQLLIPMALAGGGEFRTPPPSLHTRTNAQVIERFLPIRFDLREDASVAGTWIVSASPC
jgi:RNA 3'-terminal phosphate cyclase (ATP)